MQDLPVVHAILELYRSGALGRRATITTHNLARLTAHILPLSRATTFAIAKREWVVEYVEISEEFDYCPCGQEIKEHCYIRNKVTGHQTYVGNVCVNRFVGIDTGNLFEGLKRIRDTPTANANLAVIEYAQERGYLHDREYEFLISTVRKRLLSDKQRAWKEKISRRILGKIIVQKRRHHQPL